MEIEDFVKILISKRNLKYIDLGIAVEIFEDISDKNDIEKIKNIDKKDKEFQKILKKYRKCFRELFESYYLKDIRDLENIKDPIEILKKSYPTANRLPFYKKIYEEIFFEDGKFNVLDLASGINPISLLFIKDKISFILATEISEKICKILREFFIREGIKGNCILLNIFRIEKYMEKILSFFDKEIDYIFLWQIVALIEKYKRNYTLKLLKNLKGRYIVISFPRKSLSTRRLMGIAWKKWIKRTSNLLNLKIIKEFEIPSEYFIMLEKKS